MQSPSKVAPAKRVSIAASARAQPTQASPARPAEGPRMETRSHYIVQSLPARLRNVKPPIDKPNPKIGIGHSCTLPPCCSY